MQDHFGQDFHEKLAQQDLKFSREIPANERRVARGEYPLYIPDSLTAALDTQGTSGQVPRAERGPAVRRLRSRAAEECTASQRGAPADGTTIWARRCSRAFAKLGLLPVTTDALPDVDPAIAQIQKSKLLGTTDPERMNEMLTSLSRSIAEAAAGPIPRLNGLRRACSGDSPGRSLRNDDGHIVANGSSRRTRGASTLRRPSSVSTTIDRIGPRKIVCAICPDHREFRSPAPEPAGAIRASSGRTMTVTARPGRTSVAASHARASPCPTTSSRTRPSSMRAQPPLWPRADSAFRRTPPPSGSRDSDRFPRARRSAGSCRDPSRRRGRTAPSPRPGRA